jgi:hypothetical protein
MPICARGSQPFWTRVLRHVLAACRSCFKRRVAVASKVALLKHPVETYPATRCPLFRELLDVTDDLGQQFLGLFDASSARRRSSSRSPRRGQLSQAPLCLPVALVSELAQH